MSDLDEVAERYLRLGERARQLLGSHAGLARVELLAGTIEVAAGTSVRWTNEDRAAHSVRSGTDAFAEQTMDQGGTAVATRPATPVAAGGPPLPFTGLRALTTRLGFAAAMPEREAEKRLEALAPEILSRYLSMTREAVAAGAELVIWPESSTPFMFEEDELGESAVRDLAPRTLDLDLLLYGDAVRQKDGIRVPLLDRAPRRGYEWRERRSPRWSPPCSRGRRACASSSRWRAGATT